MTSRVRYGIHETDGAKDETREPRRERHASKRGILGGLVGSTNVTLNISALFCSRVSPIDR